MTQYFQVPLVIFLTSCQMNKDKDNERLRRGLIHLGRHQKHDLIHLVSSSSNGACLACCAMAVQLTSLGMNSDDGWSYTEPGPCGHCWHVTQDLMQAVYRCMLHAQIVGFATSACLELRFLAVRLAQLQCQRSRNSYSCMFFTSDRPIHARMLACLQ